MNKNNLVLSVLFMAALSMQAFACLCKPTQAKKAVPRLLKRASVVLSGEVVKFEKVTEPNRVKYEVVIRPKAFWKGKQAGEITLYSYGGCLKWFEVGQEYLVYAIDEQGSLFTDMCLRPGKLSNAREDLELLGKPMN